MSPSPPTTRPRRGDDIGDPNRVTRSGIRIVMGKEENTLMSNPADGYSNVPE